MSELITIDSIVTVHQMLGIAPPKHPLVSIIWAKDLTKFYEYIDQKFVTGLYMIALKDGIEGSMGYGRNSYDFTDGMMIFTKPNQVIIPEHKEISSDSKGWMLLFHPDLIRKSELGKSIDTFTFFDYELHEALHLSDEEKQTVLDLVLKIEKEYQQNIDKHSQKLITSNIELLLNYSTRYYDRQFYVRTNLSQDRVSEFEHFLKHYFSSDKPSELGIPSVKYCGEQLHMSPNYLSDLLKKETGRNAKDHILSFVINKAKNELLATSTSVSEIAYTLGFEYPQHFSKLFKKYTGTSPAKYRLLN